MVDFTVILEFFKLWRFETIIITRNHEKSVWMVFFANVFTSFDPRADSKRKVAGGITLHFWEFFQV